MRSVAVIAYEWVSLEGETREEGSAQLAPPQIFRDELGKALDVRPSADGKNVGVMPRVFLDGTLAKDMALTGRAAWGAGRGARVLDFSIVATWDRGAEITEVWAEAALKVAHLIKPPPAPPPPPKTTTRKRKGTPVPKVTP